MYVYYHVTILKVVDGDTIDVEIDHGMTIRQGLRLRLAGIDAPEMRTDEGKAAKAFLESLLPVGQAVEIETFKQEKFGRYLATVNLASDGPTKPTINLQMIVAGHAKPYDGGKR